MKQLLLSVLAFFVVPSVFSQNFEVGVNGGIGFNTVPQINAHYPTALRGDFNSVLSGNASVKAMYNRQKWQYGISFEVMLLSYRYLAGIDPIEDGNNKITVN